MKTLRFVCAGGWHTHATDFPLDRAPKRVPHLAKEFVGVWDNDRERGKMWAEALGCEFTDDYEKLLRTPDIDGVLITCETRLHEELIIKAAGQGINVFVEKALTISNESAYRIRSAVKRSGIHFTVSDPVRHGDLLYAEKLIEQGCIGEIISARSRMGNACALTDQEATKRYYDVKNAGGGAMIDMGYHNMHRLYWFLGKPLRCAAVLAPFTDYGKRKNVEESCAAVFEFENGRIGVAETSWLTEDATAFEVYGTKGIIRSDDEGLRYRAENRGWIHVPPEEIPPEDVYPLRYWMEAIAYNTPCQKYDIDTAVTFTEMITAAYESNGRTVVVEDR